MKVDDRVCTINKIVEDENKGKSPKSVVSSFALQFQKVTLEECPEEIAFVTEIIRETKE